jgi:hypothetical protein
MQTGVTSTVGGCGWGIGHGRTARVWLPLAIVRLFDCSMDSAIVSIRDALVAWEASLCEPVCSEERTSPSLDAPLCSTAVAWLRLVSHSQSATVSQHRPSHPSTLANLTSTDNRQPFHQSEIIRVVIMAAKNIEFSPAIPIPLVFDVPQRIQQLHNYLDPKHPLYQPEPQHVNIKAIIKLYEEKKIDGIQEVYVMEGKVVTKEEANNCPGSVWVWEEVCLFLFPSSPLNPCFYKDLSNKWTQITGIALSVCSKACL